MEAVGSAASIVQLMVFSVHLFTKVARFLYDVQHVHDTQRAFREKVDSLCNTLNALSTGLNTRQKQIGIHGTNQEEQKVLEVARDVLNDCNKSVSALKALATTTKHGLLGKTRTQVKLQIKGHEIQRVESRIATNIGNLQVLIGCFNLFNDRHAQVQQVESQLAELAEKVRCHQRLFDELSQKRAESVATREFHGMSTLWIENDGHDQDQESPDLKTMAATIQTANSLVEKRSRANGSEPEQRRSNGTGTNGEQSDGGVALPFSKMAGSWPPRTSTLEFRTVLLDKYMLQAEEHFKCESYAKCEEYLREAIKQGESRYKDYGQVFEQWLDIQIKLAEVFQRQGQYKSAHKLLSDLISRGENDDQDAHPDDCQITVEQLGKLYYARAGLQLYRYRTMGDIELGELRSMAEDAYYFACHLHMADSLSASLQRLWTRCASTLLEVCELEGDQVTAEALCEQHPGLRPRSTTESRIVESTAPTHLAQHPIGSSLPHRPPSSQMTPISHGFSGSERGRSSSIASLTADTDISRHANNLLAEVEKGSVTSTELLLDLGADTEQTNASGLTPLLIAAKNKDVKMLRLLLECERTSIDATDHNGLTVLHHALIGLGGKSVDMMIEALLEKGVDVNVPDREGRRPLHYCVEYNNCSAAKILLATGRVDVEAQDVRGETAAMVATRRKSVSVGMIYLLYSHGAKIDRKLIPRTLQSKFNQLGQERTTK